MKHLLKTSTLILIAAYCAACSPLPALEAQKAELTAQLKKCPPAEKPEKTTESNSTMLNECQADIASKLRTIEEEIFKVKFGGNYSSLEPYTNGYWVAVNEPFFAIQGTRIGILDPNGKEIVPPKYFDLARIRTKSPLIPYSDVLDLNTINPLLDKYSYLFPVVYLQDENQKWGGIHLETGEVVVPFKYDLPRLKEEDYLLLQESNNDLILSQIIVNKQGKVIFEPNIYSHYNILNAHYVQVNEGNKSILFKDQQEIITLDAPANFNLLDHFIVAKIENTQKKKIFSLEGNFIFETEDSHNSINEVSDKLIHVWYIIKPNQLVNRSGKVIFNHAENLTKVKDKFIFFTDKNNKTKLVDFQGNLLDFKFERIDSFKGNYLIFEQNKKYGVIDTDLNIVIPAMSDKDMLNSKLDTMLSNGNQTLPAEDNQITKFQIIYDEMPYPVKWTEKTLENAE